MTKRGNEYQEGLEPATLEMVVKSSASHLRSIQCFGTKGQVQNYAHTDEEVNKSHISNRSWRLNLKTDHKVGLFMARVVVERQQPKGISAITEIRLEAFNNEAQ